ncbi:MAG TPA: RNA-binding S4 domain-containing protein [Phnomibacter sp.]|nr:RNA-binding S4 domain-containing protein [Phnomibacter sp.]
METEKLRLDKYLWSIRVFKTRSAAAEACEKGRVKMNGDSMKASRTVKLGDVYEIKAEARRWVVQVAGLLHTRQAYSEAIKYYTDLTPPEELERQKNQVESFHTGKRLSKIGRPSKKQRRNMDDVFGQE